MECLLFALCGKMAGRLPKDWKFLTCYSDPAFSRLKFCALKANEKEDLTELVNNSQYELASCRGWYVGTGIFIGLDTEIICIASHSGLFVWRGAMLVKGMAPLICVHQHTQNSPAKAGRLGRLKPLHF